MPQIIIDISKEQEAQIMASVERRADFIIDGGTINPGNEKLRTIKFEFLRSPDVDKPNGFKSVEEYRQRLWFKEIVDEAAQTQRQDDFPDCS